jgi:hypothetical protein
MLPWGFVTRPRNVPAKNVISVVMVKGMLPRERIASGIGCVGVVREIQTAFCANKCLRRERDRNAWLAATLETQDFYSDGELLRVVTAAPFSVLPEENAVVAFALHVLLEVEPGRAAGLESEFGALLMPAFRLTEAGLFGSVWERLNPWTAARYPAVGEGISMTFRDLPFLSPAMRERFH